MSTLIKNLLTNPAARDQAVADSFFNQPTELMEPWAG